MSLIKLIDFKSLGDERGDLVALESNKAIPFEIKRVYYIFGTAVDVSRGFHAHKALLQVAICVSGSCKILMDDGKGKESVTLNTPKQGVLIDTMQWHVMYEFSADCILLVLASEVYDEDDYIRNYKKFIERVELLND
ncbi:dTDP-6-deoxy-3,4-keto-hexulose isomerase [Colwellia sp. 75C3]|uniref:sugar 3,4-ketoisomerase n=1 Tax=Colwellia sp. 75C3 TaxID=888425 RepID=UPI000C321C24|nr:FdtA/QdtA family cupin domain-containing protein [Colwellia sp. 75C3]PKG82234.1 dTDP-6-deoxy-3,4-keto-hexulose isomerase [Colwellia sp. 75C3]